MILAIKGQSRERKNTIPRHAECTTIHCTTNGYSYKNWHEPCHYTHGIIPKSLKISKWEHASLHVKQHHSSQRFRLYIFYILFQKHAKITIYIRYTWNKKKIFLITLFFELQNYSLPQCNSNNILVSNLQVKIM